MNNDCTISCLIDMGTEQFKEYVHGLANMTALRGLKNLFESEYQRVCSVKDCLLTVKKSGEYTDTVTPKSVDKSLDELYSVLMVIEYKTSIIVKEIETRKISC